MLRWIQLNLNHLFPNQLFHFRQSVDHHTACRFGIEAEQVLADPFMTLFHPDLCKTEEDGGTKKEQSAYDQMQVANAHMKAHRYPPGAEGSQLARC